jgi:hypothetical protein
MQVFITMVVKGKARQGQAGAQVEGQAVRNVELMSADGVMTRQSGRGGGGGGDGCYELMLQTKMLFDISSVQLNI